MDKVEQTIKELIIALGANPKDKGLIETPRRVAQYYKEVLSGYSADVSDIIKKFPSDGFRDLVIVKNISFYSLCEHHMVPFFGTVDIGYLPNKDIVGLSKFARLVNVFSLRLQTQERLTQQILESLVKYAKPRGCAIRIKATHLCVSMRGVKNLTSETTTYNFDGLLKTDRDEREKFLKEIN